ncbi:MAG: DUF423 domain-containing protein [Verrucomicrobiaceae bacterium]|jgi:uncharacterized membrane protein YgdD (TMEM256/DUF423 family)|nr:DUF423 domain-containing protein [Verrucomicrobiaceae bacterium]
MTPSRNRLRLTAAIGFISIVLGSLGAHGHVHDVISTNGYLPQWQTAAHYHQIHAVALLLLSLLAVDPSGKTRFRTTFFAFLIGIFLFSGSLYLLSYTSTKWLGAVTPFGGVAFMVGWVSLAFSLPKPQSKAA